MNDVLKTYPICTSFETIRMEAFGDFIDLSEGEDCVRMTIEEAKALRDWLNEVLK